jgi:DNA-binding NarL/FixJ family response regulator
VLILTGARDPGLSERAVIAGAKGIVHKDQPAEVILNAIERVYRGEIWLDRATTAKVLANLSGRRPTGEADITASLTPAERRIIAAIVEQRGAPIKVIADALCLSAHTVRNHLASIYGKLGVRGRLELFMVAKEHGLDRPVAV